MQLFYSPGCPNCMRLLDIVRTIPSMRRLQLLDIDTLHPQQKVGLQFVPTLVDDQGQAHVGSKAFEYMKKFEMEVELEAPPMGMGGLAYAPIDGGETEYFTGHGEFTAPSM